PSERYPAELKNFLLPRYTSSCVASFSGMAQVFFFLMNIFKVYRINPLKVASFRAPGYTHVMMRILVLIFLFIFAAPCFCESQEMTRTGLEVPEKFKRGPFAEKRELKTIPGVRVSVFVSSIEGARFMAEDAEGVLFLSVPSAGIVLALPDRDRDGVADESIVFARGLKRPHGLAFLNGELLVAEAGSVVALRDDDGDLKADSKKIITDDVPSGGGHWTRTVVIGPDKAIYVAAGSSCNSCVEEDKRRAAVLRFTGNKAEVFASGLRNTVGLEFHPRTGALWGADNGRDMLGDDIPPEEVNLIERGKDYGWPYCYGNKVPDPGLGSRERCAKTTAPEVEMQAHSAPLGVAFGFGLDFPK
ncbi:hypothetical protein PLCT1_02549, partial [Planctomycetaceae bacterium]